MYKDIEKKKSRSSNIPVQVNYDVYTCIYIYCLFLLAQENTTKTQPGLEISFKTKLRESISNFLDLAKFLRLEETLDWSKLL